VRVDLLVTEGQNEYVLEVNTLPGLTPTSLLPKIAGAAGFSFGELCMAMLERAKLHTRKVEPKAAVQAVPELADEASVVVRRYGAERRSQRSRTA
jgi:hypothetical protein